MHNFGHIGMHIYEVQPRLLITFLEGSGVKHHVNNNGNHEEEKAMPENFTGQLKCDI